MNGIFDFFRVYDRNVWTIIISVFVLATAFGMLVRHVEYKLKMRNNRKIGEVFWKMLRFQLVQSEGIAFNLISGKSMVLIFSIFQICIILGLFQGFILSGIVKVGSLDYAIRLYFAFRK
jgi:lipoprotein signal peptidase